ncbi:MAG: flhB [Bacillales bacterium]|jgi:flagellar biosynthetic protein FlhB|nr:flhB [Bacillales bacterium]
MLKIQLDLQFFSGEKTEKATPKRREDSRKKGQVAKSADLNTAFILFFCFLFLFFLGNFFEKNIINFFKIFLEQYLVVDISNNNLRPVIYFIAKSLFVILGPVLLIAFISATIINYVQVGFIFSTEPLTPKLNKLDPIQGFKKIYSMRALVELAKSILKISFVGFVAFYVIWSNIDKILLLSQKSAIDTFRVIYKLAVQTGLYSSGALLFLSIFDYAYQKFDFEKNIKMSKQDIKDEYKKSEGDPLIKSKIKQKQREMAMRRMMQEIPKADVVITNPTHFAIALKYDENNGDAPIVVAKGVDYLALKIKKIAKEHEVVMVENRPLARALYDQAEIGKQIPENFFKAVAEILAYVYKLKKKIN